MALVNPNIAMSFRQPEFRPRNALAEYAQVQQIVGGQRQAEMADMQMEELRRERDALGRIQAAIVAKGGPPDLGAAADEMIRTGRPQFVTQGMAIRESLKKQRYFEEFESRFGAGRAAPSAAAAPTGAAAPAGELVAAPMPSPTGTVRDIAPGGAPGAASRAVFNQDAIVGIDPEAQKSISLILDDAAQLRAKADEFRGSVRASGFLNQAEQLENQAASMLAVQKRRASEPRFDTGAPATAEQVNAARQALAVGQTPPAAANALAPAAAPVTNAMIAPAAQPAVPPAGVNQLASAGAGPNIDDLMARYDLAAKAGHPRAPVILKQIEAALQAQGKTATPQIKEIGVATKTNEPVYFDARTDEQFTIATDATGKQVRKPYTGGVNRATSTVTATATSSTPTAKSLAAEVGQRANTSLVKAEGAAGIMENANMVREALNTGNVIAGPLAGVRTKFAQVLELAGAGDKEKLVNTRSAIQGLASLTLESRAELKGQGQITDTETKLLERARSAEIGELTIAELQQVVNVSQRLANRMWSNHQNLLKTMEGDPAAADSIRYYRPSMSLPQAIGEGRPQREAAKRTEGLDKIFKPQPR